MPKVERTTILRDREALASNGHKNPARLSGRPEPFPKKIRSFSEMV